MTPQNATAVLGETFTVSCHYPCKFYSQEKYWCKWSNKGCHILPSHDEGARQSSVSCDQSSQLVSMTLNPVSKEDEGWYWCGVKQGQTYGETTAIYIAVEERTRGEFQGQSVPAPTVPHGEAYERPLLGAIGVILKFSYKREGVGEQIVMAFLFNLSIQISLIGASQTRLKLPLYPATLHSNLIRVRLISVHFLLLHMPKTAHEGWPSSCILITSTVAQG